MATVYGVNADKALVDVPSQKVDVSSWQGRVRWVYDEYTAGALALNDKIIMGRLPEGAKIVEAILMADDLGTTGLLDFGYEYDDSALTSDPDAFLDDADVKAAAASYKMTDVANAVGFGVEMQGEASVVLTVAEAIDVGGDIRCAVAYVLD